MADVSGPGRFAKRTDLTATGGAYGERKAIEELQSAAPMVAPAAARPSLNLSGPSARPSEPVTAGAPFGAGAGPEVLPTAPQAPDETAALVRQLASIWPDPALLRMVEQLKAEGR